MRPKKIATVASQGDNLETLKALRQKVARAIDDSESGRDIAALSRQLQLILISIAELEAKNNIRPRETVLDIIRMKHNATVPMYAGDDDEAGESY